MTNFVLALVNSSMLGNAEEHCLQELPDTYLTDYVSNVFAITPEKVSEMTAK
jgi:hypothetical protein